MGMQIGASVRVKCESMGMEFNNAKLLAISTSHITIASANGERFDLPKEATTVEAPVSWERTPSVMDGEAARPGRGIPGSVLFLLLLVGVGAAGWFWLARRRDVEVVGKITVSSASAPLVQAEVAPLRAESDTSSIESLIENRCYGTAQEQLEKQIKLQPDEFHLRLLLLKVYVAVGNGKQMDRVAQQISLHSKFSPEQKEQAHQALPPVRKK